MPRKSPGIFVSLILLLVLAWMAMPVAASPRQPQAYYYTPTANPNGRIVYIVQPGDTCISISLLNYVTLDNLRLLNNLDTDCTIVEGQELLLAIYQEQTPTVGIIPMATPTPLLALATPFSGNAQVCVLLYVDVNGNAMAEEGEVPLAGGAVSLSDKLGTISRTGETTTWPAGAEASPLCFADIPEGEYNISVAIPDGYNATTIVNYTLAVKPGDQALLDFGAQPTGQGAENQPGGGEDNRGSSILLALLGGALVLTGIGLGIYVRRLSRSR